MTIISVPCGRTRACCGIQLPVDQEDRMDTDDRPHVPWTDEELVEFARQQGEDQ